MTAITGETGAGKTLIVEALKLLMGGRGEPAIVRPGAKEALVEARFDEEGAEILCSRTLPVGGRSRSYFGGEMATLSHLAEGAGSRIDLYAQHGSLALLKPATQRDALDAFATISHDKATRLRRDILAAQEELNSLSSGDQSLERELDFAKFQVSELEAAKLHDDREKDKLLQLIEAFSVAQETAEAIGDALEALGSDYDGQTYPDFGKEEARAGRATSGSRDGRSLLAKVLPKLRKFPQLAEATKAIETVLADMDEAVAILQGFLGLTETSPAEIDRAHQRLSQINEITRKYGGSIADANKELSRLRDRISEIEGSEAKVAELRSLIIGLLSELNDEEARIFRARQRAGGSFAQKVSDHLSEHALPHARFEVTIEARPSVLEGDKVTFGNDRVEFRFSANPGIEPAPIAGVASGGELSRAMLAIQLVNGMGPPTIVFDEVDAGVGGASALAIGRALKAASENRQVIVVTHLPQVAAFADHQVRVTKIAGKTETSTTVEHLGSEDRITEIARMLSGSPSSASARDHARELLDRCKSGSREYDQSLARVSVVP